MKVTKQTTLLVIGGGSDLFHQAFRFDNHIASSNRHGHSVFQRLIRSTICESKNCLTNLGKRRNFL